MQELWSEEGKFAVWLEIEILVCEAWAQKGKIPQTALENIKKYADFSVSRIDEIEQKIKHDVIAFTTNLAECIGPDSRFVHMGLTSSDVVDTALSVRMSRSLHFIDEKVNELIKVLEEQAIKHKNTVCIGRTHGVHAEPVTLGFKFLIWREEWLRNKKRLEAAKETISVGKISGAVGTYAHTGAEIEKFVCERLGLAPAPVSSQILQRDRHAEYLSAIAIAGASLEKIALEIRGLQRTEIYEVEEPFGKGQKGSSAMPHKRNPVTCEQICGLARLLRGNLLAGIENVALWHERDISHSSVERVIIPDSSTLLHYMIHKLTGVLKNLNIYKNNMLENIDKTMGLIYSQRVLLALLEKNISREEAYEIVQRNAMRTWQEKIPFKKLLLGDPEFVKFISEKELTKLMDYKGYLNYIDDIYRQCGIKA